MDYLAIGDNLVSFEDNRIVADRDENTEPEDFLLKLGSIKRLEVFKSHGTDEQMSIYLDKLSDLIGEKIEPLENRNIKYNDSELDIDNALQTISDSIRL